MQFLKHSDGRASGPEPLDNLFRFTVDLFKKAVGRKLNSLECHDLVCAIASAVVVGGVRRSATLSLSNLSDDRMRNAKTGQWWIDNPQRALANNSVAYTEKPEMEIFLKEWLSLIESKSGERGIFNRVAVQRKAAENGRRKAELVLLTNPCVTGDTMIAVADGRNMVSIKELAEQGKDVPVYCINDQDVVVIKKMVNPRITGFNVPVYEVEIEGGHKIRVTGNHKFLTKDNGYKEVKDLVIGDSLSILSKYKEQNGSNDYWHLQRNENYKEHLMIAESVYGEIPKGMIVHHLDNDSLNNTPDNLRIICNLEHNDAHNRICGERLYGDDNGHWYNVSNDQIREHAKNLCLIDKKPFSVSTWCEYAKNNGLPQSFSETRTKELGSVKTLSRWAAIQTGVVTEETADLDLRQIEKLSNLLEQGYDVRLNEEQYIFKKTCPCGKEFETLYRENQYCSQECKPKFTLFEDREKRINGIRQYHTNRKNEIREKQAKVFSDLSFDMGRKPLKDEWIAACKENGLSSEISRKTSPFISYSSLKEYASLYNHKVVSIKFSGYEDVYNGTVEDCHNFFVGGWEEDTRKRNGKRLIFLNNLQCGEILLRSCQFCNLSEIVVREDDTLETLLEKVRISTIIGTVQSTLTNFRYLRSIWKKNTEEERLLGVSLTGHMDHPILSRVCDEAAEMLDTMKLMVYKTNEEWAERLGIEPSVAMTTVKPSGTVSELVDSSSGIHPRYAPYYIRTVRADATDPLAIMMRDQGVPCEVDVHNSNALVFSFPKKSPKHSRDRKHISAIEQLEHYKMVREHWCDHNISITIYVKNDQWLDVGAWVYKNWDSVGGISFLPYSDHVYKQAPYTEITEEQYNKMMENFPVIDFTQLSRYENYDRTVGSQELSCTGGVCELI